MKRLFLFLLLLPCFGLRAGSYRHDVGAEKYKALAAQPQFDCVCEVLPDPGILNAGCGVLISDRYILSAAHVFIRSDTRYDTMTLKNGSKATIFTPVNRHAGDATRYRFRFGKKSYQGKSIKIYPVYLDSFRHCDIALIELSEPVKDIRPATPSHSFDELHAHVYGAGFGASGDASKPEEVDAHMEKIAGENIVDKLEGYELNGKPTLMACDFDHPTNKDCCNKMGTADALPLEYVTIGGDSGCGLFRNNAGGWQLIGILTGGGTDVDQLVKFGYYGQVMQWTRVSLFYDWIKQSMK